MRLTRAIATRACAPFVVLLTILAPACHQSQPQPIVIATGTEGGTCYLLGEQLARIVAAQHGQAAQAETSLGSLENLERLRQGEADIAFVMRPALSAAAPSEIGILARLYTDAVQVVVHDPDVEDRVHSLDHLRDKRVFIGPRDSGTRIVAERLLGNAGLTDKDYKSVDFTNFREAAQAVRKGDIDAAFIVAGTPTEAVRDALRSGTCRLLSIAGGDTELVPWSLPAGTYDGQPVAIPTLGTDVFLVCRADLDEARAFIVVKALFSNVRELLVAHTTVNDIRLERAFKLDGVATGLALHTGARQFREWKEQKALVILGGAINGKYFELGKRIQSILEPHGIESLVVHTDGSVANARTLARRPALAIMQYDVALACRFGGRTATVYGRALPDGIPMPAVEDIRRIATLHREKVHIFRWRGEAQTPSAATEVETFEDAARIAGHEGCVISVGPEESGTRVLAHVILSGHDDIQFSPDATRTLSVADTINQLYSGKVDAGFFVSDVPSKALRTLLGDPGIQLLSIGSAARARIVRSPAFEPATINSGEYACLPDGERAVQTVATRAVLVTRANLPFPVEEITRAIFEEGEGLLDVDGGAAALAEALPSLPLHDDALAYYQQEGLLPALPGLPSILYGWLTAAWRGLAVLALLGAGYKGAIMLKRDRTGNAIGRRILAISVRAGEPESVAKLLEIRREIEERVRRRWWRLGELNKARWRYLHDLINDRIEEAKGNLMRALVAEIGIDPSEEERAARTTPASRSSLRCRIVRYFENGELDASHFEMLLRLLGESKEPSDDARDKIADGD